MPAWLHYPSRFYPLNEKGLKRSHEELLKIDFDKKTETGQDFLNELGMLGSLIDELNKLSERGLYLKDDNKSF